MFGGTSGGGSNGASDSRIVFNKDSDDESDPGIGNVEELIKASDDEGGEAIGIDWN